MPLISYSFTAAKPRYSLEPKPVLTETFELNWPADMTDQFLTRF